MIDEKNLNRGDLCDFCRSADCTDCFSDDDFEKWIDEQPKVGEWIPCSEQMPKEHDSMFAKLKNTDKWSDAMFEKLSDDVNVTVEFEDGTRMTKTMHTTDGKWRDNINIVKFEVIAWQPLPEPYKEECVE